jgi:hypothetical protein
LLLALLPDLAALAKTRAPERESMAAMVVEGGSGGGRGGGKGGKQRTHTAQGPERARSKAGVWAAVCSCHSSRTAPHTAAHARDRRLASTVKCPFLWC